MATVPFVLAGRAARLYRETACASVSYRPSNSQREGISGDAASAANAPKLQYQNPVQPDVPRRDPSGRGPLETALRIPIPCVGDGASEQRDAGLGDGLWFQALRAVEIPRGKRETGPLAGGRPTVKTAIWLILPVAYARLKD